MRGSRLSPRGLRPRVFAIFGLALLILLVGGCFSLYWQARAHLRRTLAQRLTSVHQLFQAKLDQESQLISGLTDGIEGNAAVRRAWRARDRQGLLAATAAHFAAIQAQYRITHLYFFDLDRVCFLRVHNRPRFGDTIARFTLTEAVRTGQTTQGLELGPYGTFTYRVVRPWRIDGQLVGYIELGEEIEHITKQLRAILDAELFFAIDKTYLNRPRWEEGLRVMRRHGQWGLTDDFVFIDRTMAEVPPALIGHLNTVHTEHSEHQFAFSLGPRTYRCGIVQLREASGRDVGDIFTLIETTRTVAALNKLLTLQIAAGLVVAAILCVLFWGYLGRVERELALAQEELETALEREHTFAADVAHELRTPLAGIRSTIDVALTCDHQVDQCRESLRDCSEIVAKMQSLVGNLLMLARLDGKQPTFRQEQVVLADVVRACWRPLRQRAEAQGQTFENHVGDDQVIVTDPDSVAIVFANVLENSVEYADPGGRIWVTGEWGPGGSAHVTVANTGCQLTPQQARMAFRQFWRADGARDGGGRHTGLGLALVRRLTTTLGGDASAEATEDGVFTVHIVLPRVASTPKSRSDT
jgi:signal transduction histidine kinase